MSPKSQTLFHFTKSEDKLKSILLNGFYPNYCLEDCRWYYSKTNYVAVIMTCFCDIPLSRISNHIDTYGHYGIGLSREWAVSKHLNPVIYISEDSNLYNSLMDIANTDLIIDNYNDKKEFKSQLRMLRAHVKPLEGNMVIEGVDKYVKFYKENEWRYVPTGRRCIVNKATYDDKPILDELFERAKKDPLKFKATDIKYIFVEKEVEVLPMIHFIRSSKLPRSDVLATRVLSMETIVRDV
jgi:hypothetical protein